MPTPDQFAVFLLKLFQPPFVIQKQPGVVLSLLMVHSPNQGDHHHLKLHVQDQRRRLH